MKCVFSLLCCFLLLINSYSIPSLSKDTFLINNFSVNGLELGMSINNAKKQLLLRDSVVLDMETLYSLGDSLYYVYYHGNVIMSYNSKNDSLITWIEVFSPIFYTQNGFRVNDNIEKFIDDFNDNIEQDELTGLYFLTLEEKKMFWLALFFDEEGTIQWIGIYDSN